MTNTTCPMTTDGAHDIAWMDAPAMHYDGGAAHIFTTPPMRRGICLDCDERFFDLEPVAA
jgi:hypothetical protein